MKKNIIFVSLFLIVIFFTVTIFNYNNKSTNKIRVAEVTHSVFYVPWYIAIENGYFEDEGLEIELILTPGADKVSAAILSNDVDIGLCGPESNIYVYNAGEEDYIQSFAGLTKRDGQFIVSREKIDNFKLTDLYNKEILVGRNGGMPALNFINALYNDNIFKNKIDINYSVDFNSLSGSFIGGLGDFVNLFEPNATKLENAGLGYIVASVGSYSGEMPYTTFNARKSYINNNKDTIKKFNNALNRGLEFVSNNDSSTLANILIKQFPDSSIDELTTIIDRYKNSDTWLENIIINEQYYENLENIMMRSHLIDKYVPFNDLVNSINFE